MSHRNVKRMVAGVTTLMLLLARIKSLNRISIHIAGASDIQRTEVVDRSSNPGIFDVRLSRIAQVCLGLFSAKDARVFLSTTNSSRLSICCCN